MPAALLDEPQPLAEGRHVAFTLAAGGARSRCVLFGAGSKLPADPGEPVGAIVRLEVNRWNGSVEPRLVLNHVHRAPQAPIELVGEPAFGEALEAELDRDLDTRGRPAPRARARSSTAAARASAACSPTSWPAANPCSRSPRTRRIAPAS